MVFADRDDAGRRLAARLGHLRGEPVVVLGLPRGGVPVAFQVAQALGAPLDVIVVRKLGVPFQPELGMGAVGEDGVRVINPEIIDRAGVPANEGGQEFARAPRRVRLARRDEQRHHGGRGTVRARLRGAAAIAQAGGALGEVLLEDGPVLACGVRESWVPDEVLDRIPVFHEGKVLPFVPPHCLVGKGKISLPGLSTPSTRVLEPAEFFARTRKGLEDPNPVDLRTRLREVRIMLQGGGKISAGLRIDRLHEVRHDRLQGSRGL